MKKAILFTVGVLLFSALVLDVQGGQLVTAVVVMTVALGIGWLGDRIARADTRDHFDLIVELGYDPAPGRGFLSERDRVRAVRLHNQR